MSTSGSVSPSIATDFITLAGTYFYLGKDLPLDFTGAEPFTIEGWMGFTSLVTAAPVFTKAGELMLGFTADGRFFARRRFWQNPLIGSQALEAGLWHHLGVTCDGERWTLYVNGIRDAEDAGGAGHGRAPSRVGALRRAANLHCEAWNVRIWNVARSAEQIAQAMESPVVPQTGLLASFFPELPAASLRVASDLPLAHSAA